MVSQRERKGAVEELLLITELREDAGRAAPPRETTAQQQHASQRGRPHLIIAIGLAPSPRASPTRASLGIEALIPDSSAASEAAACFGPPPSMIANAPPADAASTAGTADAVEGAMAVSSDPGSAPVLAATAAAASSIEDENPALGAAALSPAGPEATLVAAPGTLDEANGPGGATRTCRASPISGRDETTTSCSSDRACLSLDPVGLVSASELENPSPVASRRSTN
jgi:hypothetical protein